MSLPKHTLIKDYDIFQFKVDLVDVLITKYKLQNDGSFEKTYWENICDLDEARESYRSLIQQGYTKYNPIKEERTK
jgi:hypothetical protein